MRGPLPASHEERETTGQCRGCLLARRKVRDAVFRIAEDLAQKRFVQPAVDGDDLAGRFAESIADAGRK